MGDFGSIWSIQHQCVRGTPMSGAALVERPFQEDEITRTAEFEADLLKMRDADKAETLVDDERPRIICVHAGYDRALPKGSIPDTWVSDRSDRGISARINPGQKNGAFNKFEDVREARGDVDVCCP